LTDVRFWREAAVRGSPTVLREVEVGKSKPYSFSGMQKIVQRMRKDVGLPVEFTLDACRHGGMTEPEEAELTEGQGRALSAHRTKESYAAEAIRMRLILLLTATARLKTRYCFKVSMWLCPATSPRSPTHLSSSTPCVLFRFYADWMSY
jgi:hypothetical protein